MLYKFIPPLLSLRLKLFAQRFGLSVDLDIRINI